MHSALIRRFLRRGLWACVLALGLGAPLQAQVLEMSRPEALDLARVLYLRGDAALANAIARSLVAADPLDVEALLLLSASEEALGNAQAAIEFGRRAWEAAGQTGRPGVLRYEIARQTAHAAATAERFGLSSTWLKRSIDVAPGPDEAAQSAQDLAFTRSKSPVKATLNFQIAPTTNINGGSVTDLYLVDDVVIGGLTGWAEAQPGVLAVANLDLLYTLPGSGRDRFGLSLTEALPKLAPWAARENPELDDGDLESRSVALRFEHDFRLPLGQSPARLTFMATQSWAGGDAIGPGFRGQLEVSALDTEAAAVLATGIAERQWTTGLSGVTDGLSLALGTTRKLPVWEGTLQMGVSATFVRSDWVNTSYDSYDVSLGWVPDAAVGGVNWSALIVAGVKDHDRFQPIPNVDATRGRQDTSLQFAITLQPETLTVFGLTPSLTLSQKATWSNISRGETLETSAALGLSQQF